MEMQDPTSTGMQKEAAAETPSTQNEIVATPEIVTENGIDPEAAAEAEVTEAVAETAQAEIATEVEETVAEAVEPENAARYETIEQVLDAMAALADREAADISRDEVSRLRQQFENFRKVEIDAERTAYEAAGNDPATFEPAETEADTRMKALRETIKQKKAAHVAAIEAEKAENLKLKNEIIDQIIALAGDTDNVNRTFDQYRELQAKFNAIGHVTESEETNVWKRFQEAREQYSDNLKINKELRDYDFKKNLEQKELIISEAATLKDEADIITAYRRLQMLRDKWREIGPVAKELRDQVWEQFKASVDDINRRYQAHFEERKAREAENEAAKTAICERIEALDFSKLDSFNAWEQMTETLKEAQAEWKKLGFASRKMNNALFNRFRATCDSFFALKAAYYKGVKDEMAANLERKTALAEAAEALKDSTEWRKTTDRLVELQKEWKTIGAVAKKHSDAVWHRFQQACDAFFAAKKAATSGARQTEQANLQAKRDLIKELDKITAEMPKEEAQALVADLQERWKSIGHVPFREKDKVYEQFRARINEVRDQFGLFERRNREVDAEINGPRDRDRQMRLLETRRAELRTYENNLGFLTAKSKSGNSMVREFERKIERLRSDIATLEQKIRTADAENNA